MTLGTRESFERVWPWLLAAMLRYGKTHDKEHLWELIEKGEVQLFPLPHGAFCATIQTYPTELRECHFWLAGGDLGEMQKVEPLTMKWAKSLGCQRATLRGRKGWVKVLPPGWEDVGTILVKELT